MGCVSITNTIDVQHNVAAVAQNAKDTQRRKSNYPQSLSGPPLRASLLPLTVLPCNSRDRGKNHRSRGALDVEPADFEIEEKEIDDR